MHIHQRPSFQIRQHVRAYARSFQMKQHARPSLFGRHGSRLFFRSLGDLITHQLTPEWTSARHASRSLSRDALPTPAVTTQPTNIAQPTNITNVALQPTNVDMDMALPNLLEVI